MSSRMKRSLNLLPLIPFIFSLTLALALSPASLAQTTQRRTTPARKAPVTTPQRQSAAQPGASTVTPANSGGPNSAATTTPAATTPIQIVIVNGQTFSTSDFDPAVRQELETVDQKIADARRSVLDLQINTMLLDIEAKKRGI